MRIGIDAMGGDHAPDAIIDGAIAALEGLDDDDRLILVGNQNIIEDRLNTAGVSDRRVEIIATTQIINMDDSPVEAVRTKRDSSMAVLAVLGSSRNAKKKLGHEPADAIISAGNTGAFVAAAQMELRRLPKVHRPGITVTLPTFHGPVVLLDVGANIEPKPMHLAQYGVMGTVYAQRILGIEQPRVALMNVGGEEQKGTGEMKKTHDLLRADEQMNFIGNIEGRAVFDGKADVVITDGVVGNVMIKLAEGLSAGIFKAIAREILAADKELAVRFEPIAKRLYAKHDYHEHGGAPLLGVNGVCLISHGSAKARTITNAILRARQFLTKSVNDIISQRLGEMESIVT